MPPIGNRRDIYFDQSDTGATQGGFDQQLTNAGQIMGLSDGFTLMKGISSYGLKNMIKKANIDEDHYKFNYLTSNNTSELSQANQSA